MSMCRRLGLKKPPLLQVNAVNLTLSHRCLYLIQVYDSCCWGLWSDSSDTRSSDYEFQQQLASEDKSQYFTLTHVVRVESEDSPSCPRTVWAVQTKSEQSEDCLSSPRTVRAVLLKHYFLFCSDFARTLLGLCSDCARTLFKFFSVQYIYSKLVVWHLYSSVIHQSNAFFEPKLKIWISCSGMFHFTMQCVTSFYMSYW